LATLFAARQEGLHASFGSARPPLPHSDPRTAKDLWLRRDASIANTHPHREHSSQPNSLIYAWVADTAHTLLPQVAQMGTLGDEVMPIETLESRLRAAVVEASRQIEGPA
jgi:hypothetical protein